MKKEDNPCFECPDRSRACHDTCKRHKKWKERTQAEMKRTSEALKRISDETFRMSRTARYYYSKKWKS